MVTRVYPEDILARHRPEPDEPDPERAFEPVELPRRKAVDASLSPPGGNEGAAGLADPGANGEPEGAPEAAPPARPVVRYLGDTPISLPLRYPVEIEGVGEVLTLTINPPALWDIQDWAAGRLKTNFELMARMVGLAPAALGSLRWPDIERLADIVTTMLPPAVRAGIEASKREPEKE
jgi:hypothetical protein